MQPGVWPRRAGVLRPRRRLIALLLVALLAVAALGIVLPGALLPAAADHALDDGTPIPTTTIGGDAFADTLAIPLDVLTHGHVVGWDWKVRVDLRVGVEDPVIITALLFQYQVVHTDVFFFGAPELSAEPMANGVRVQVVPTEDRNSYEITLRSSFSESLPPGDHWVLLAVPDSYSLSASVTLAYDLGNMTFATGVVHDNDGKLFHLSDFHAGTAIDTGNLVTETSAALAAERHLTPHERMVFFAFFRPNAGHWVYQDDFDGQVRTHTATKTGSLPDTTPSPTLTATTTAPATLRMTTALGTQAFEHPFRFVTVDLDF